MLGYNRRAVEILFGIIVIALLVLILATMLGGEEGFVATLGCAGVSCAVAVGIAISLILIFALLVMFS